MTLTKYQFVAVGMLLLIVLGVGLGITLPSAIAQQASIHQTRNAWPLVRQTASGWKLRNVLQGHEDAVQCLAFGPNNVLISGGKQGHIKVWDADAGKELVTFQNMGEGAVGIVYAPDATWVAFRFDKSIALSFDTLIQDGKPLHIGPGFGGGLVPLALAPDGKTYAWREGNNYTVEVLGLDLTKKLIGEKTNNAICTGHSDVPLCAAFSPGKGDLSDVLLATGSDDMTVRLWEALTGKEKFVLKGHAQAVIVVEFSPDGKTLATGSKDGAVKLWDVMTGKELFTMKGNEAVNCLTFSPDGKSLASSGDDKVIKLWNVTTGLQITTMQGHTDSVIAVRFNRDGKLLATTGADKTIRVWQYQK